jgi:hypothetical protein
MAKHKEDKVWVLKTDDSQSNGYVKTIDKETINIHYYKSHNINDVFELNISRRDARLLAARIIKCLQETK